MVGAEQIIEQAEAEREEMQTLLRPVAEFFHDHEGELFERYEAVDELVGDESIPSSDERMLHRVVGNLAADRVDPVQNVVQDDAKYVGVLDYDEHDYWYEYTEVNDVHGRMNVGVCAQCVKEADSDAEVARGCGTTEELSERIRDHYEAEHSEDPESVETGATLVSGTTIAGNTAIHTANDGQGSGLDADQFRGTEGSGLINTGTNYSETTQSIGASESVIPSPNSVPSGVGIDSLECIWNADNSSASIYKINRSGTIQTQFSSPSSAPSGVGIDSDDCIWNADDDVGSIYKLNQSGVVQTQFQAQDFGTQGIDTDSNTCIWNAEFFGDSIYKLDRSGNVQVQFASPSGDPRGLGIDSSDCIWNADSVATSIYKINRSGTVQDKFSSPSSDPNGVGLDLSDNIWHADFGTDSIYKLTTSEKIKYE